MGSSKEARDRPGTYLTVENLTTCERFTGAKEAKLCPETLTAYRQYVAINTRGLPEPNAIDRISGWAKYVVAVLGCQIPDRSILPEAIKRL
jgi:hypothetical protein